MKRIVAEASVDMERVKHNIQLQYKTKRLSTMLRYVYVISTLR